MNSPYGNENVNRVSDSSMQHKELRPGSQRKPQLGNSSTASCEEWLHPYRRRSHIAIKASVGCFATEHIRNIRPNKLRKEASS